MVQVPLDEKGLGEQLGAFPPGGPEDRRAGASEAAPRGFAEVHLRADSIGDRLVSDELTAQEMASVLNLLLLLSTLRRSTTHDARGK